MLPGIALVFAITLSSIMLASATPGLDIPAVLELPRVVNQQAIEIPDTRIISMSPDGRWIAGAQPAVGYERGRLCVFEVTTLAQQSCADLSSLRAGLRIEDVIWSPDGSRLAFSEQTFKYLRDGDLWVMDALTGALTNVDDDGYEGNLPLFGNSDEGTITQPANPAFSPDGQTIAFSRSLIVDGDLAGNVIATVPADGSAAPQTVAQVTTNEPGIAYYGIRWMPDGQQIVYSVHHRNDTDPQNGIWIASSQGGTPRQVLGAADDESGAPAVVQVTATGDRLLAYYPLVVSRFSGGNTYLATVDLESGAAEWLTLDDPNAPEHAWISMAAFSPDGTALLLVSRLTTPDYQVFVRDVATGQQASVVPEGLPGAVPVNWSVIPTWATNGTALIPDAARLSNAVLLEIEGGNVAPPA